MDTLLAFVRAHAYAGVLVGMIVDAMALPFPGRVVLIAAGAFAAAGELNVVFVVLAGAAGALVGDHVWYVAGVVRGEQLLSLYCRLVPRTRRCADRARFLLFDVAGALLWSATFVGLGYALGARAPAVMERLGLAGSVAIAAAVTAAGFVIGVVVRRVSRSLRGAPRPARDRRRRPAA